MSDDSSVLCSQYSAPEPVVQQLTQLAQLTAVTVRLHYLFSLCLCSYDCGIEQRCVMMNFLDLKSKESLVNVAKPLAANTSPS